MVRKIGLGSDWRPVRSAIFYPEKRFYKGFELLLDTQLIKNAVSTTHDANGAANNFTEIGALFEKNIVDVSMLQSIGEGESTHASSSDDDPKVL